MLFLALVRLFCFSLCELPKFTPIEHCHMCVDFSQVWN